MHHSAVFFRESFNPHNVSLYLLRSDHRYHNKKVEDTCSNTDAFKGDEGSCIPSPGGLLNCN